MTIVEKQMARAYEYAELWRTLMPDVEEPGEEVFAMWAGCYTEKQVTRGLSGAARKRRAMRAVRQSMTASDVLGYAASIMRHELQGVRRFDK